MRLLGFPLEGCTRILVGACPEQGRMGGDDEGRGLCKEIPAFAGMTRKERKDDNEGAGRCQCCRDSA